MKLFIAINFTNELKDEIYDTMVELKKNVVKGNFVHRENLHLTLVFIGETENVQSVMQAMKEVNGKPFELFMGGLGKFKRRGGDIYWIGVEKNEEMSRIYNQLSTALRGIGFHIDNREFTPHLTLGRDVVLDKKFNERKFSETISKPHMKAEKVSLMKSERIEGKVIYTEIYSKDLK